MVLWLHRQAVVGHCGSYQAAVCESASMADDRRLLDTTRADADDKTSAAARGACLGTVLLALLACLALRGRGRLSTCPP